MQLVITELIPCPDPWDVARKLAHWPYALFLDSRERHPERGRYSYVMANPSRIIKTFDDLIDQFFAQRGRFSSTESCPCPFTGGFAGLFSYDLGRQFESIPEPTADEFRLPALAVGRYDWCVAFDHEQNRAWFCTHDATRFNDRDFERLINDDAGAGSSAPDPLARPIQLSRDFSTRLGPGIVSNFTREDYLAAVQRVIEYIHAGDVFQVNLSQRLSTPLTMHPLDIYARLRQAAPAPYACYFNAADFQVMSASPEQFLRVSPDGQIVTRPIKGTRPRGISSEQDAALVQDLVSSPKDRAENVMIVDLLRNDLGKVAEYGTVTVPRVCELETHSYVHHLVSEVRGRLRTDKTPLDLLRAAFPGGSVTGAPKVRAMQIIAELEPTTRGPYCGSIGFIGFNGAMDTSILIRTMTAAGGWLQFPVGGGIVADSSPEQEYEETLTKARGLLPALQA